LQTLGITLEHEFLRFEDEKTVWNNSVITKNERINCNEKFKGSGGIMVFKRVLRQNFIDELNRLYDVKNSWWRKMVDDKDVFLLIRNNKVHVLVNGGLLLLIRMDMQGKMICEAHEDFLSLRSESNTYVKLDENSTAPIKRVDGLKGLSKNYQKVKRRIRIFTGKEKQAVQHFSMNIPQIIDLEIGLEGDKKEGALQKGSQRVDMAGISDKGILSFFEVKLFDNSEIRSKGTPKVIGQLKKYEYLLKKYNSEILDGYGSQFRMYEKLQGSFFLNRFGSFDALRLNPDVRLIITGFDGSQQKYLLPTILNGIRKSMDWDQKSPDLIAIGNHKSLKKGRLFKGI